MNIPHKNYKHRGRLPLWQSEKMRNIIESRWEEVWKVAVNNNYAQRGLHRYLKSPQRNYHL
jgi:hypothetical protein